MGGSINMAFRFKNGDAYSFSAWTNSVSSCIGNLDILKDETICREYIKEAELDDDYYGRCRLSAGGEYGLILIDYISRTIIDHNSYTSLFGGFHEFELRQTGDEYFDRKTILVRDALDRGMAVWGTRFTGSLGNRKVMSRLRITEEEFAALLLKNKGDMDRAEGFTIYDIDLSPWTYSCKMQSSDTMKMVREIGFPTSRKDGLNKVKQFEHGKA